MGKISEKIQMTYPNERFEPETSIDYKEIKRLEKLLNNITDKALKNTNTVEELEQIIKLNRINKSSNVQQKATKKLIELRYGKT